ncbi:MAG: VanZ family protein [Ruminococcus sp.]|nr:VanZ family protein [Ruminococcus sp.]
MDLLLKNPMYFFETYFAFSPIGFLIAFAVAVIVLAILCRHRFRSRTSRWIFIVIASLYLAVLIGITLLNTNRISSQSMNLNPMNNIREMFGDMGVHQVRGCISNIIFFIPFGIFVSIYFKYKRIIWSLLLSFCASVIIEALQFVLHRGCAETMDVVCNTLGAVIGAAITVLMINMIKRNNKAKE